MKRAVKKGAILSGILLLFALTAGCNSSRTVLREEDMAATFLSDMTPVNQFFNQTDYGSNGI